MPFQPGPNGLKTFYARNLGVFVLKWCFFPDRPFQPSLMFVGKARSLP